MTTNYQCLRPHAALGDIVGSIWVQDDPHRAAGPPSCVIPTGTAEILFHYGHRFVHETDGRTLPVPRSYVTGQRTAPVHPAATGSVGIVIVSLCPWALPRLFPQPAADLTDGYVDLRLLTPAARVERLENELADGPPSRRVALVQAFLMEIRRDIGAQSRIRSSLGTLAMPGATVSGTARKLGWSARHLQRRFLDQVGVTPKQYQRISRFQRALASHRANPSWSAAAAACGFSDQAHLIREARALSGRTPREIGRTCRHDDDLFNVSASSRFFDTVYA